MARYIIEFMFCSGLFVALYKLLIKGRVAHHQARLYLVGAMFLSVIIPVLELPLYPAQTVYFELPIINLDAQSVPSSAAVDDVAPVVQSDSQTDWRHILSVVAWGIYILVFALNIARFVYRLWLIRRLRMCAQLTVYEAYTLAVSERISAPFSFWRTIYMNRHFVGREREQIIIHELSHIRHHHTAERLLVELLRCVFWFNPFVWLVGNYLVEVQEWEADSDVLSRGYDVYEYRQLIFRQLFGYNTDITCGLNSQLTKNRFLMMTNFKKGKLSFMRFGVAIPMVGAMILAFGAVRAEAETTALNVNNEQASTLHKIGNPVLISADGTISYKGKVVTLPELEQQLAADRSEIDTLTICADNKARVGVLDDVKLAARNSGVLKVNMSSSAGKGVYMVLPPPAGDPNAPVKTTFTTDTKVTKTDFNVLRVKKNNLLCVGVNSLGKIMTTRPDGKEAVVELDELKDIVKQFVDNTEWVDGKLKQKNPNYSSFRWENFKMGDGKFRHHTSNGVVSIHTTRDLSVENYLSVQIAIREAFAELREELAQYHFSRSLDSLRETERDFIMCAIPIKVSTAEPDIK